MIDLWAKRHLKEVIAIANQHPRALMNQVSFELIVLNDLAAAKILFFYRKAVRESPFYSDIALFDSIEDQLPDEVADHLVETTCDGWRLPHL